MENESKKPQSPAGSQARPRWQLIQELREAAAGTSTDFWGWWWMLSKSERRTLLDAMA